MPILMTSFFVDHGQTKLHTSEPTVFNLSLFLVFTFLILITSKKTKEDKPLSILQTNQMKALAILMVILYHLSDYVIERPRDLLFFQNSGYVGVAIFLVTSGFGLCISIQRKGIKSFFSKRIIRVFVPLFLVKLLVVILNDFLLPTKTNNLSVLREIPLSSLKLDGSLWFITFILFWYCLTYVVFRLGLSDPAKIAFLCAVSAIIITIPCIPGLWTTNALSYPFGCWLGLNSKAVVGKSNTLLKQKIAVLVGIIIIGFSLSVVPKMHYILLGTAITVGLNYILRRKVIFNNPIETISLCLTIIIVYFNYLNWVSSYSALKSGILEVAGKAAYSFFAIYLSLIVCLLVFVLFKLQRYSVFLNFVGEISFELYLLHGIFIYSFDFILFRGDISVTFFVCFAMMCLASVALKRLSSIIADTILRRLPA